MPALVACMVVAAGACLAGAVHAAGRAVLLVRAGMPEPSRARGTRPPFARRRLLRVSGSALGVMATFALGGPVPAAVAAVCAVAVPRALGRRRLVAARTRLESQLAASVASVAAALRAGLSLSQAVAFAASEAEPPVGGELTRVVERENLGLPLDESLSRWSAGSTSGDVRLVADVLRLRVGSGLPRVLDHVCLALGERESTRREVRSLTAQARLSGTILGLLPIGFFVFLSIVSRHDMAAAYSSPVGLASIAGGLVLDGLAFLWIRSLVAVWT